MSRRPGAGAALPTALGVLLLAACSAAPRAPVARAPAAPGSASARAGLPAGSPAARVVAAAYAQLGAPYRYSGAGPRSFDCSGLTRHLFATVGVALPRTAAEQAAVGSRVALDELVAGDLVFFSKAAKASHVGVVVSSPGEPLRMIHASTSRGVIETEVLRDGYWLERLLFGRRVLPGGYGSARAAGSGGGQGPGGSP